MRVKICGITHKDDAHRSIQFGASMLGLVFARRSPRYLSPEAARILVQASPPSVVFVGVFVDEQPQAVLDIAKEVGLKKIQLQGSETPETCRKLNGIVPTIKAFRVDKSFLQDPTLPERYLATEAHLFDSKVDSKIDNQKDNQKDNLGGGSGQVFDWRILESIPRCKPRILAGGLNEGNIVDAVAAVRPDAIDLSTSLAEDGDPRRKDIDKMERFFRTLESL